MRRLCIHTPTARKYTKAAVDSFYRVVSLYMAELYYNKPSLSCQDKRITNPTLR
jgi:hypothetical protein